MRWTLILLLAPVFFFLSIFSPQQAPSAELTDVCFEYTGSSGGSLILSLAVSPQGAVPLSGFRIQEDGTRIPVTGSAIITGDKAKLGLILVRASETTGTVAWDVDLNLSDGIWRGTGYFASLSGSGEGVLSGELILVPCSSISVSGTFQQKAKATGGPEDGYVGEPANAAVR